MKTEATLGGRKMLTSETYLIPPNESLKLTLIITPEDMAGITDVMHMPVSVVFEDDSSEKQHVEFKPVPNEGMQMCIKNWNNPLGTTLKAMYPVISMRDEGFIDMMIHNVRIGETNVLTLQFWKSEGSK
ncbi:hypothetical protein [Serratia proteamaculans]|uniref:hypothetical protein n=1 Tax=Serratia proteamaculans TaxID=28151 RepID=UPI0021BD11EC|nr:hypothetical protein [Serratia proteamaculans]